MIIIFIMFFLKCGAHLTHDNNRCLQQQNFLIC